MKYRELMVIPPSAKAVPLVLIHVKIRPRKQCIKISQLTLNRSESDGNADPVVFCTLAYMPDQQTDVPLLQIFRHDDEFISAGPEDVFTARALPEDPRRFADQYISGAVTFRIIGVFQSVQIN